MLPRRAVKPRETGLTMVIDGGLPLGQFTDADRAAAPSTSTSSSSAGAPRSSRTTCASKIAVLEGTTSTSTSAARCSRSSCCRTASTTAGGSASASAPRHVEVSNGTIALSNAEKAGYVRQLADEFTVVSARSASRTAGRSEALPPQRVDRLHQRGPGRRRALVITEARESGKQRHLPGRRRAAGRPGRGHAERGHPRAGTCSSRRPQGAADPPDPPLGPDVNLGNIAAQGVISAETLRLGLRADTLTVFEQG